MSKPIIMFVSDVPDFKGGAERSLFDLMANPHVTAQLVIPEDGPISQTANDRDIKTHTLDFGSVLTVRRPFKFLDIFRTFGSAFKAARQLKKIVKEQGAICVHTNGLKAHGTACLARLIGGVPVVVHYRAIPFTKLEKLFWNATQIIASQIILVSRPCWHGAYLPKNVQVIFNAINLPDRNILPPQPERPPFVLGFIGRIQFTKGVDTLIEWFDYARNKGLDIKLSLRGEPAPDELDYDEKVRTMAKERGLEQLCTFEGKREGFDKIYGGIHANVVSSVVPDPLPRSIMEASALGIPVIGYPAGGIPYMFEDKKSGLLVKDEREFYDAVKKLIEDEEFFESVGRAAVENAKNNFGMNRLHDEVMGVYKKLIR